MLTNSLLIHHFLITAIIKSFIVLFIKQSLQRLLAQICFKLCVFLKKKINSVLSSKVYAKQHGHQIMLYIFGAREKNHFLTINVLM